SVYVTGGTGSGDFPAKDASPPFVADGRNAFVVKFDAAGALVYSTPVGSGTGDAIAADATGNVYVAGSGAPLGTTPGAFQTTPGGSADAFVVKLAAATGDATPPTVAITKPASGAGTGNSINITAAASDTAGLASLELGRHGSVLA